MDYNSLMQRYWRAETSAAEERELKEMLTDSSNLTTEERAARAMMRYTSLQKQGVNIRLRQSKPRYWQMALAACACSLVAGLTIWLAQPTVYGYYNGEPITSLAEAQYRAERVFANLAQAELPSEEELMQKLFLLDE